MAQDFASDMLQEAQLKRDTTAQKANERFVEEILKLMDYNELFQKSIRHQRNQQGRQQTTDTQDNDKMLLQNMR